VSGRGGGEPPEISLLTPSVLIKLALGGGVVVVICSYLCPPSQEKGDGGEGITSYFFPLFPWIEPSTLHTHCLLYVIGIITKFVHCICEFN